MELSNRDGKVTVNHPAVTPVSLCLSMRKLLFRDGDGKMMFFLCVVMKLSNLSRG